MTERFLEKEQNRYREELSLLHEYPIEELATVIRDVGFACTGCGDCCRAGQNGHVFLLTKDTERALEICANALIPAPFFEICNSQGIFYVSGYALRTHPDGSCVHLTDGRCRIYEDRFTICRVYPYMLHREPDEKGRLTFRQISGLNEHGEYHTGITREESLLIARETISYEEDWLIQMIEFYDLVIKLFKQTGERHVRKIYDQKMRRFRKGEQVEVFVFYKGEFIPYIVSISDYEGIIT